MQSIVYWRGCVIFPANNLTWENRSILKSVKKNILIPLCSNCVEKWLEVLHSLGMSASPKVEKVFQVPWLINNCSLSFAHLLIQVYLRLRAHLGVIYDVYQYRSFKSYHSELLISINAEETSHLTYLKYLIWNLFIFWIVKVLFVLIFRFLCWLV